MTEKNTQTKNVSKREMRREHLRTLCEGAVSIALAVILNYLKIDVGAQGGSINFTMVPLIVFALRRGASWGFGASIGYGILKVALGLGGDAIAWQSIVFDYVLAYGVCGFAFVGRYVKGKSYAKAIVGCSVACVLRYLVHFVSGVTIYAEWMPDNFLGMEMESVAIYSFLYNGLYMIPTIICALIVAPVLYAALERMLPAKKI